MSSDLTSQLLALVVSHSHAREPTNLAASGHDVAGRGLTDDEWSVALGDRSAALEPLIAQGRQPLEFSDRIPVLVCAGDKRLLTLLAHEDLLPPSDGGEVALAEDGSHELTAKQAVWIAYWSPPEELGSDAVRIRIQRLRESVRAAVALELMKPGPKPALIDIVFEIAGHGLPDDSVASLSSVDAVLHSRGGHDVS